MQFSGQLDKTKIRGSFAQAATTYDAAADLQKRVGQSLLTQILARNLSGVVLDVGCGTGFLINGLAELADCEQIIGLDIALPMLQKTRQKITADKLGLLCADAEFLPLSAQTVDCIVSNLALQWCENLEGVFADFKRVLKPDGQLSFSTFGGQTLQELKNAWATVDTYSHVNHFYNVDEISNFLQQAGFQQIRIESHCYLPHYPSVFALMRELKAIGAHNITRGRRKTITGKATLYAMISEYEGLRSEGLIPATFEIITVTARA